MTRFALVAQVIFGHLNITTAQKDFSRQNNVPIDCVWKITVEEGNKIYLQIKDYELQRPNECNLNQIQVRQVQLLHADMRLTEERFLLGV